MEGRSLISRRQSQACPNCDAFPAVADSAAALFAYTLNGCDAVPSFRILVAALLLAAGWGELCASGQTIPPSPAPSLNQHPAASEAATAPMAQPPSPDASGPDVFLLPDASGNLRRVLGYRYEDFFNAWRSGQAQQGVSQPKYVLANVSTSAKAVDDGVNVEVTCDIDLQSSDWVEVPLEMGTLVVSRWKIEGDGERDFLKFDPDAQCFVAWLKGNPGERRTVSLTGHLIVQRDGEGRRIEIDLPTATTSQVEFTASTQVEVESPKLSLFSTETADDGQYTSHIEGAKGRLALRWGPRVIEQLDETASLSSNIDAALTVEPGRLTYEAFVTVRSFGDPLDRVRVRLPQGASLASLPNAAGYEVIPIASAERQSGSSLVEIRFAQPSSTPPPFRLLAEQGVGADPDGPIRATAFEIVGAFRQRSVMAMRVSDLIHADFKSEGRVEQIDPLELPEALQTPAPLAAFVGSGDGWGLQIETQPRQRKVRATPTYVMHLGSHGATLDVTLDYQFLGGRTFELRAKLHGWELSEQPIESGGAVDLVEQHVTPEQILVMPLQESDLPQARVRFSLRREAGLGLHDLPLPELLDAFTLPGVLTVTCEDAWRATVQVENSSGIASAEANGAPPNSATPTTVPPANEVTTQSGPLVSVPVAGAASGGSTRRESTVRRFQTFLPRAGVAVDVSEREQAIAVESIVEGSLNGDRLELQQRLQYDIAYQPASELTATVSANLLSNEGLQLLLDGKQLASGSIDILPHSTAAGRSAEGNLRLLVRLPRPTVGRVVLHIRSAYELNADQRTGQAKIASPLAIPDQPAKSRANFSTGHDQPRMALWSDGATEPWLTIAPESTGIGGGGGEPPQRLEATASLPVNEIALRLVPLSGAAPLDLRIDGTWMQTWITGGQRQDRFVYRFRTSAPQVELTLPDELEGRPLETILDGQVITADRRGDRLTVALATTERLQSHTLELRRHAPQRLGPSGNVTADMPAFEQAERGGPLYWQLVVPREMAVVTTPEGMNSEYQLGWRDWSWGRQPTQSQTDLERWTGATEAPPLPASTNEYLFSSFDVLDVAVVSMVRRIWLIVGAGVGALAIGLACLYTQLGRTAGFWLAVLIAAAAGITAYPEASVLLVQAVFLGGVFTLVSVATKWLLADIRPRTTSYSAPASSVASLTATQPWLADKHEDSGVSATSGTVRHASEAAP